ERLNPFADIVPEPDVALPILTTSSGFVRLEIRTGTEGSAVTGKHDAAYACVLFSLLQGIECLPIKLFIDGVQSLGAVEPNVQHTVLGLRLNFRHRYFLAHQRHAILALELLRVQHFSGIN